MGVTTALLAGIMAGFAVAVPLGPVGVLLVDRGVQRGLRTGLAAAAGVGTVDLAYGVVAVTSGTAVGATVATVERPATLVAAGLLAALGLHGLVTARRAVPVDRAVSRPDDPAGDRSTVRTFAAFVGLTALNPATVLTFAAIAVAAGDTVTGPGHRGAFVLGIGLASLAWQAGLATLGAAVGRRPRAGVLVATRLVGSVVLLAFAVVLVAGLARGPSA